jgi:hypothetical protein
MIENKAPHAYEVGLIDIQSIYQNQLHIPVEFGSFFYGRLNKNEQSSVDMNEVERNSAEDALVDISTLEPDLIQALKCIASPEVFITLNIGGGGTGLDYLQIHQNKQFLMGWFSLSKVERLCFLCFYLKRWKRFQHGW